MSFETKREKTYLTFHGIGINLAHVCSGVAFQDIVHVKFPSIMAIVSHIEPRILRDHVRVNC